MGVIRRIKKIVVGLNPGDNTAQNLGGTEETHQLSDQDDALESVYCEEKTNLHCGCFGAPGGRCSECGVISCEKCHRHCGGSEGSNPLGCGKPLCREHSHYLEINGVSLPFCKRCYGKITRSERWRKIGKAIINPFVETGGNHEER